MQQASRASDYTAFFNLEATGWGMGRRYGVLAEQGDTATRIFSVAPGASATQDYITGRFG